VAEALIAKNWRDLIKPRGLHVEQDTLTDTYGKFVAERGLENLTESLKKSEVF